MKKRLIFFFLIAQLCNCYAQKELKDSANNVKWQENINFSWDYFSAGRTKKNGYSAMASTGMSLSMKTTDANEIICTVQTILDKKKSWCFYKYKNYIDVDSCTSNYLLNHELGHFNISEIYSRKLRQSLSNIKANSLEKANRKMQEIYALMNAKLSKEQEKYDKETKHSKNKEKQTEWDKKIAEQLKELETYKDLAVIIRLF